MPVQITLRGPDSQQQQQQPAKKTPSKKPTKKKNHSEGPPLQALIAGAAIIAIILIMGAQYVFGFGLGSRPTVLPEKPLAQQEAEEAAAERGLPVTQSSVPADPNVRPSK